MKHQHVAILVPRFPNLAQTYILNQIAALKRAGADVYISAKKKGRYPKLPAIIIEHDMLANVAYVNPSLRLLFRNLATLPLLTPRYWRLLLTTLLSRTPGALGFKYVLNKLVCTGFLATRPVNIIHSQSLFTSLDYLFARRDLGIPMVTTYHGKPPPDVPWLDEEQIKLVFHTGDLFLANTKATKTELVDMGCPVDKIRVLPQGMDLVRFPFVERRLDRNGRIVLLSVGRLSVEKGHKVAIEAMARLADKYLGLEYHLVGDGPEYGALQALAIKLGIAERVFLHGFRIEAELLRHYAEAHILLLPSFAETQGAVIQEAQSSGLPVIASDAGGIPEVVEDGVSGMLFSAGNVEALADSIRTLILSEDLYVRLVREGRNDVENRFEINHITDRLIAIYDELESPLHGMFARIRQ